MGQLSRAAWLRKDVSHVFALPFNHLFYREREREREMPTTGESRDRTHETAPDVNDTQLLTILHNQAHHTVQPIHTETLELPIFSQVTLKHELEYLCGSRRQ